MTLSVSPASRTRSLFSRESSLERLTRSQLITRFRSRIRKLLPPGTDPLTIEELAERRFRDALLSGNLREAVER